MGIVDLVVNAYLDGVSQAEEDGGGKLQSIGSLAVDDWNEWSGSMRVISEYRQLHAAGEPPPTDEWSRALNEAGNARRQLANNAAVVLRDHVAQALSNLRSQQGGLQRLQRALKDVHDAIDGAAAAQQMWEVVDALNDAASLALSPNVMGLIEWQVGNHTTDRAIEMGIAMLGNYYVLVTLAAHGMSSLQELEQQLKGAFGHLREAAEYVKQQQWLQGLCEELYEWKAHPI